MASKGDGENFSRIIINEQTNAVVNNTTRRENKRGQTISYIHSFIHSFIQISFNSIIIKVIYILIDYLTPHYTRLKMDFMIRLFF